MIFPVNDLTGARVEFKLNYTLTNLLQHKKLNIKSVTQSHSYGTNNVKLDSLS